MLAPLLHAKQLVGALQDGYTGKENGPLLHGAELAEIAAKEDDRNAAKVFRTPAMLAELFVRSIQRPHAEHADLVDDQQVFLLPVHPDLPINVPIGCA